MCGIAGEIRFDGTEPDVPAVARITAEMHRRGPDGSGGRSSTCPSGGRSRWSTPSWGSPRCSTG
jgi:asparagine synthase (glutamine-hydrolysing)